MAKNVAIVGRRELVAHRRWVTGVTASVPRYQDLDGLDHKEWVVDVYLGPLSDIEANLVKDVPIAPYARQLVTDIRQPVELERSKQGQYTVVGRAKILAAGAMGPEDDILEPTFHQVKHNFADLKALFVADLDYDLEPLQADPGDELQPDPDDPLQVIRAYDAFGAQVLGPEVDEIALFAAAPASSTLTRHVKIAMAKLGPKGDPEAMDWGVSVLQPAIQTVVTNP